MNSGSSRHNFKSKPRNEDKNQPKPQSQQSDKLMYKGRRQSAKSSGAGGQLPQSNT